MSQAKRCSMKSILFEACFVTKRCSIVYSCIGVILISLYHPIQAIDYAISIYWEIVYCGSGACRDLSLERMVDVWLYWLPDSLILAALLSLPATWKRQGGKSIFDFRSGRWRWNQITGLVMLAISGFVILEAGDVYWGIVINPSGMMIPFLFMPILTLALCLWILHLRALFFSPKVQ